MTTTKTDNIKEDMDSEGRSIVVKVLARTLVANHADVVQQALPLMSEDMSSWCRVNIVVMLVAVPTADRTRLVTQALALMTEGMSGDERINVINTLVAQRLNSTVGTKHALESI